MERFKVEFKKSALKQLRLLPQSTQDRILNSIKTYLAQTPYLADGIHIKKLTEGYRLRVGNYRVFYYIEKNLVIITSVVRRTSKTY